jgi:hypothetical protein
MTMKTLSGGNNEAIDFAIGVLKTNLNAWAIQSTDPTIVDFVRRVRESITVLEDVVETIQGVPSRLQQDDEILKLRSALGTAIGIGEKLVRDLYSRLKLGTDFEQSEATRKKHNQLLALRKEFVR